MKSFCIMPLSHLVQALGPEVEDVQAIFRSVARKTPAMQTKLDKCLNKWNQLWSSSHVYIERLKCVEIVLTGLEEATTVVSEFELKLASYEELPSNVEALQVVSFMNTSWQAMLSSSMMIVTMAMVHCCHCHHYHHHHHHHYHYHHHHHHQLYWWDGLWTVL